MNDHGNAYYHTSIKDKFVNADKDISIYRFLPLNYVIEMIQDHELTIGQTQNWDDCYENFLAKATFYWGQTPVCFNSFLPCFFGQCWTRTKESDALWRIYSKDKQGVRIKTSINRLLEASINEVDYDPFSTILRVAGKVQYLTEKGIFSWINDLDKMKINSTTLVESLFIKRKEFNHEKEVRLLIQKTIKKEDEYKGTLKKHINLSIDPNIFIDEITFDPRINDKDYQTFSRVLKKIGYKNKINKSNLYTLRQFVFTE